MLHDYMVILDPFRSTKGSTRLESDEELEDQIERENHVQESIHLKPRVSPSAWPQDWWYEAGLKRGERRRVNQTDGGERIPSAEHCITLWVQHEPLAPAHILQLFFDSRDLVAQRLGGFPPMPLLKYLLA